MKNMRNKILFTCIACASMAVSCTKKIDEAYQSPNADVKVPVENLLPPIIASMAANAAGHGPLNDSRYVSLLTQNFSYYTTGVAGIFEYEQMGYRPSSDNAGSLWRMHYYDLGQNLQKMIQWGVEDKKWDYVGIGYAILAWSWLQLTDYHGDVILDDAFNTNLLTFKYNTQPEVYAFARQQAITALDYLSKTGDGVNATNLAISDNYLYKGDLNKWKKFAYAVLARSYNHLSNKAEYKPDSVIYYCNKSLADNNDNAYVKFASTGISGNSNFYGPFRGNVGGYRQGAFIADLMSGAPNTGFAGVADPRAIYMLRLNPNATFKGGTPNKGLTLLTTNDRPENFWGGTSATTSAPPNDANCRYIFRNNADVPVITAAEVQFMKAEAAFKKGDKATALAAYTLGISLNFDMLSGNYATNIPVGKEITPVTKAAYLANPLVVPVASSGLTITQIMLQKYIALFGHGVIETWVDMRRYHYNADIDAATAAPVYKNFTPPSGSDLYVDNGGKLAYRFRPRFNSEYVWNINELGRIGADKNDYQTLECWFSKP
ncbi:MAG: SusD/RagB family nutrient-binding outer membrane lipoprotein [Chitinophagaceae bacterium]